MSEMNNRPSPHERGQALVEYALIVTLVIISFGLALAATGPAIGNVFSNQIYNIVGADPNTVANLPDAEAFWLTVTWAAEQTPEKRSLATRTLAPATPLPTAGTPPSATPITPTLTPTPTYTPSPSPTPADIGHVAPWFDSANPEQLINWRIDNNSTYFGSEDWHGTYYPNNRFQTAPDVVQRYNYEIDENLRQKLSFNWGNGAPVTGFPSDNFSVIYRRPILITEKTTIEIDISTVRNMGIRVYILGHQFGGTTGATTSSPNGCSTQGVRWNTGVNVNTAVATGAVGSTPATDGRPVPADNLYIDGTSTTKPTPIKKTTNGDRWQIYDDTYFNYNPVTETGTIPTECLLIDRWVTENSNRAFNDTRRTIIPADIVNGSVYTLHVELSHGTGEARIDNFSVRASTSKINKDNAVVDNSGNTVANASPECNWGNFSTNRSDTLQYTWDEFANGNFRIGTRCFLELRGWVEVPATLPNPHLVFWDAWDIRANVSQWVEIADYDPNNDGVYDPGTETHSWQRINLHSGNVYNYTWTPNAIDLAPYLASIPSKKVALRFGMQSNANASGDAMKWYIDTISIDTVERQSLYMNQSWNLNSADQAQDFVASGNWNLSSERAQGAGMAWHESVNSNTRKFYEQRTNTAPARFADINSRIHSIEFNGFIDTADPLGQTDMDGHQGDPLLTFFHSYQIGRLTGMEIQYTTDNYGIGYPNWLPVPNGGILFSRDNNSTEPQLDVFEEVKLNLKDIPATRFRLRFALIVNNDGTERNGWFIENIKLERDGRPQYLTYPYYDNAEDPVTLLSRYILTGQWDRVAGGNRPGLTETGHAYHDSPAGQYPQNTTSIIMFKEPLDLYNDTLQNTKSPACNLGAALCGPTVNATPVNPMMSFWYRRVFGANITFSIQWRRTSESNTSWRTIWAYEDGMTVKTTSSGSGSASRKNVAWELVEVDLRPLYAQLLADNPNTATDANKEDDDVVFRFYFQTRNSSTDDGVYIDDIRFENRQELVWKLWESGQQKNNLDASVILNSNGTPALGDLKQYYDTLDFNSRLGVSWFDTWKVGGGWQAITFEQHDGVLAFHDSVTSMTDAGNRSPDFNVSEGTNGNILSNSFNVLEMKTILDLRGVLSTERPLMYFWSRWYAGSNDRIGVQVSIEDPNNALGGCINGAPQCLDKQFGWGPWETVWSRLNERTYTWERQQIDLSNYARGVSENGKRIKIRFITDALNTSTRRDGWYIDEVLFTHYNPRIIQISKTAASGGVFIDKARNTINWVTEGKWGLTPTLFFGGGGGSPDSLGGNPWSYRIWDYNTIRTKVTNCNSIDFRDCANTFLNTHANSTTAWHSGLVSEIRENWGNGGPRNASNVQTTDRFVYRWEMTTPSNLVPNKYTFITSADDGIRVKYNTEPTGGLPAPQADDPPNFTDGSEWNIINNWQNQARTTTISSARIEAFKSYKITVEYFESYGSSSVQLSIGSYSFSFTSAPPGGTGRLASDQVPTMRNSNASMILNGVLDLTQATNPYLRYYQYHELGGTARVEVSVDGGFTWTQDFLEGAPAPASLWSTPWYGFYWNTRNLDFDQAGGWKNIPEPFNFATFNFNGSPAPQKRNDGNTLNFSWGGGRPHPSINTDNVSVRWIRKLATTGFTTLKFTTTGDDGVRLWVNYSPGCAVFNNNPAQPIFSGGPRVNNQDNSFSSPNSGCLLIDNWVDQGGGVRTAVRTVPPGAWIMADYYEASGGASFKLDVVQGDFDSPTHTGTYTPDDGDWRMRIHDLTSYAGAGNPPIGLRFRLDRRNESNTDVDNNQSNSNTFNYLVAWWLTEFEIADP